VSEQFTNNAGLTHTSNELNRFNPSSPIPVNQPKLILTSFGLNYLKPQLFKLGQRLQGDKHFDSAESFNPINTPLSDSSVATSYLGTPIFSNLIIPSGSWVDLDGNTIPYGSADPSNPYTDNIVLFSIQRTKRYVVTEVTGRDNGFIEHISNGNYQISIKGVIISPYPNVYPKDQVRIFKSIFEANKSIKVVSEYLQNFDIDQIYITDVSLEQLEGCRNMQPYEITALSDTPFEIIVNE
jgi:hypothetical protein